MLPKENSDIILEQKEIVVPKHIVKAFGRGLSQSIGPRLQQIESCLRDTTDNLKYPMIEDSVKRITNVLHSLEEAKEVKISIIDPDGLDGYLNDFLFSEETEELDPKPGELLMENDIAPKFINALQHTIINPLFIISGRTGGNQSEEAKKIYSASMQIKDILSSFTNAQEIKIVTDVEGNTKIIPLHA